MSERDAKRAAVMFFTAIERWEKLGRRNKVHRYYQRAVALTMRAGFRPTKLVKAFQRWQRERRQQAIARRKG